MLNWNRKSVTTGLAEIALCREELLHDLKNLLDDYHHWKKPTHYYDALAGDWLEFFTHLVYIALQEAALTPSGNRSLPIPVTSDLLEHSRSSWQNDHLHEHLKSAVTQLLDGGSPEAWLFSADNARIISGHGDGLGTRATQAFSTQKPEVLLVEPYFKCSRKEHFSTLLGWRRWARMDNLKYPVRISVTLDKAWRKHQAMSGERKRDLKALVRILLPLHIPVALLEGFADYRKTALNWPLHRPNVVYSANALHNHLSFKLLLAEWQEEGTRLLYHQHGGGYGVDQTHVIEEYETRVTNQFFSWGWTSDSPKVSPLSPAMPHFSQKQRKSILLSCANFPKVAFRLHFHPMPGTIETLHQETCAFLSGLNDHRNLLVRPYAEDYGWGAIDMMREAAPDALFDDRRLGSFERFAQSRLVVHNYLGTTYLETLALNIPTVCFFDSNTYAFRPEAQPYFDALESVGILHRSGLDAAKFVSGLSDNPEDWWAKAEVQTARQTFVSRYARFSKDWRSEWETAFQSAIAQSA